jgi:hypothetical protein
MSCSTSLMAFRCIGDPIGGCKPTAPGVSAMTRAHEPQLPERSLGALATGASDYTVLSVAVVSLCVVLPPRANVPRTLCAGAMTRIKTSFGHTATRQPLTLGQRR